MNIRSHALLAAAVLTMAPAAASAQSRANTLDPAATTVPQDDDDDFPWGLLGILGLAGLLGLKRRDDDVRVDRTANASNRM